MVRWRRYGLLECHYLPKHEPLLQDSCHTPDHLEIQLVAASTVIEFCQTCGDGVLPLLEPAITSLERAWLVSEGKDSCPLNTKYSFTFLVKPPWNAIRLEGRHLHSCLDASLFDTPKTLVCLPSHDARLQSRRLSGMTDGGPAQASRLRRSVGQIKACLAPPTMWAGGPYRHRTRCTVREDGVVGAVWLSRFLLPVVTS